MLNTWTCHICGDRRPDENINVDTYPLKGLLGAEMNIRYCNDRSKCVLGAIRAGKRGKFPHPKTKKVAKKWYEFWKGII